VNPFDLRARLISGHWLPLLGVTERLTTQSSCTSAATAMTDSPFPTWPIPVTITATERGCTTVRLAGVLARIVQSHPRTLPHPMIIQ
jgi:hypothetical protein